MTRHAKATPDSRTALSRRIGALGIAAIFLGVVEVFGRPVQ